MKIERQDVYSRVTERLLADLEKGVRPWLRPWNAEHMEGNIAWPERANGQLYKGVNVLMLWASAEEQGFTAPVWMTFKQAKELGGSVRKGSKGSLVVYANRLTRTETASDGKEVEREIPFMKGYTVFNVQQVDGLPERFYAPAPLPQAEAGRLDAAEAFVAATRANIRHGGNNAFYSQAADFVQMPPFPAFQDAESYYATLAHELTHWTKHPERLDRDFGRKRFGDEGYAREELVAEIGAAFLCCGLGITPTPREDHASYLSHWIGVLKADNRAIFQAASHAQKAADYLHSLQNQPNQSISRDSGEQRIRPAADTPLPAPLPLPTPAEVLANPNAYLAEPVGVTGPELDRSR